MKLTAADGAKLVFIMCRPSGSYRFIEYSHVGKRGKCWVPTHWSGDYATAEAAERDAREMLAGMPGKESTESK